MRKAGLIVVLTSGSESVCGSSIVSNNRLLTAAHCWRHRNSQGRQLTAVMGSVRLFTGGLRLTSNNVQMHANYNEGNLNNDIAIIMLTTRITFNNNINRINIASGSSTFAGNTATASGFGRQGDNQGITQSQSLRHVAMQVITNAACAGVYGPNVVRLRMNITETQLEQMKVLASLHFRVVLLNGVPECRSVLGIRIKKDIRIVIR
ncbi:jg2279 [Pararge aegeria aegeria]|uniref:Jg2279 protein n=1 Tax=Pararge aegeria aegeria TaxID=348720 RepID=A0A8S4RU03_9NEOP|nr:jg2279 [Pararge aegeria aegeria]